VGDGRDPEASDAAAGALGFPDSSALEMAHFFAFFFFFDGAAVTTGSATRDGKAIGPSARIELPIFGSIRKRATIAKLASPAQSRARFHPAVVARERGARGARVEPARARRSPSRR
jgi:hypothetical protein